MSLVTYPPKGLLSTRQVTSVGTADLSNFAHVAKIHDDITIDGEAHVVDRLDEQVLSVAVDIDDDTDDGTIITLVTKRTVHMHKGHT